MIVSRDTTIAFLIFGSIFKSELMLLKCLLLRRSLDFTSIAKVSPKIKSTSDPDFVLQ